MKHQHGKLDRLLDVLFGWLAPWHFFALGLLILASVFFPAIANAQLIPGASAYGIVSVTNNGTHAVNIWATAKNSDGEDVPEESVVVTVNAGSTTTFNIHFPSGGVVSRFEVYRGAPPATKVGASLVYDLEASVEPMLIAKLYSSSALSYEPYPTTRLTLASYEPLSDGDKTIWMTSDATLTGDLAREGFDKVVAAIGAGMGSTGSSGGSGVEDKLQNIIDNQNRDSLPKYYLDHPGLSGAGVTDASDALTAQAEAYASQLSETFNEFPVTRGAGVTPTAPASATLADFTVPGPFSALSIGFNPLSFAGSGMLAAFSPKLAFYGVIVRELLLWLSVAAFWYYSRDLLEKYYLTFMTTPQITTKTESFQIAVPGAGWSKQFVVIGVMYATLLLAVGGTIVAMNTGLGNIAAGMNVSGAISMITGIYDSIAGSSSTILPFYENFVPLAAMIECFIAQQVFAWGMPVVWAVLSSVAKVLHV